MDCFSDELFETCETLWSNYEDVLGSLVPSRNSFVAIKFSTLAIPFSSEKKEEEEKKNWTIVYARRKQNKRKQSFFDFFFFFLGKWTTTNVF